MNLIEIKSNYARTTSFIIYLNNFNKKLDRYRYFFSSEKHFEMLNNIFYAITKSESIEISKRTVSVKLHDFFLV